MLLAVVGFKKSSTRLMVILIATRRAWLCTDSLNRKVSTTLKPSVLLLNRLISSSSLPLLYLTIGRFVSLMYIIHSSMVPPGGYLYVVAHGFCWPWFAHSCLSLHKSLYGLKQALRAWYTRLSNFLLSIGFYASKVDTSLFILIVNHDIICYMFVYVDDILLTGNNST
jgi:hypothetical protein